MGIERHLDVSQGLAMRELGENHAEQLAPTWKVPDLFVALVFFDGLVELVPW